MKEGITDIIEAMTVSDITAAPGVKVELSLRLLLLLEYRLFE